MIDSVVSVHTNPLTCGTAKFNAELARQLGVPLMDLDQPASPHPLYSLRAQETDGPTGLPEPYSLFLHEIDDKWRWFIPNAVDIWAGNQAIADWVRPMRPDVHLAHCPATVTGNAHRGDFDVLCFGMAHKFQAPLFEKLRTVLAHSYSGYTISLSTAIHEGSSWDEGFTRNQDLMREVFGSHLRCMGFLADDGLARLLRHVNLCALFFEPAARANNTSLWAALEACVPTVTNLDALSPRELIHGVSVLDIHQLQELPQADEMRTMRHYGLKAAHAYSWDRLIAQMTRPVHAA